MDIEKTYEEILNRIKSMTDEEVKKSDILHKFNFLLKRTGKTCTFIKNLSNKTKIS